jgi:hypothetical protein
MVLDSASLISVYSLDTSISLLGNLKITAESGVYDLAGSGAKGTPGANSSIYFSALSID